MAGFTFLAPDPDFVWNLLGINHGLLASREGPWHFSLASFKRQFFSGRRWCQKCSNPTYVVGKNLSPVPKRMSWTWLSVSLTLFLLLSISLSCLFISHLHLNAELGAFSPSSNPFNRPSQLAPMLVLKPQQIFQDSPSNRLSPDARSFKTPGTQFAQSCRTGLASSLASLPLRFWVPLQLPSPRVSGHPISPRSTLHAPRLPSTSPSKLLRVFFWETQDQGRGVCWGAEV